MSIENEIKELTSAVRNLAAVIAGSAHMPGAAAAIEKANGAVKGAVDTAAAATAAAAAPAPAAPPAPPKLNKDGETETYTKEVKPVLMAFVKSHGREFVLGHLAKAGFDATGLTPIKGGERKPGEYAATIAHMQAGQKEPSPTASLG